MQKAAEGISADGVRCHDLTVPFPTAAIADTDPFAEYETHPFPMEVDEDHVVRSWVPRGHGAADQEQLGLPHAGVQPEGTPGHGEKEEIVIKDGNVDITVTVTRSTAPASSTGNTMRRKEETRRRPRYPPMLFARYPYTYVSHLLAFLIVGTDMVAGESAADEQLPILLLPLIFPLWLCFVYVPRQLFSACFSSKCPCLEVY